MEQQPAKKNSKFQTLKPNIKKIFLKNTFNVLGIALLITIIILLLHFTVGLGIFLIPFESIGVTVDTSRLLLSAISSVFVIIIFILVANYLITQKVKYEFHFDKIIFYENHFLYLKKKQIPYLNIIKVLYNDEGIFNKLFNSGTIVLELTGMKEAKAELEFIDNVEQNVKYIQNLIKKSRLKHVYPIHDPQFDEAHRIKKILDQY